MSKSYIEKLKAEVEAANLRCEEVKAKRLDADPRVVCDKPLTQQIEELMRSLPPTERQRRWTMAEFVARLTGRYSARPHPMQIGAALRALGWSQMRDWSKFGGNGRRYWVFRDS